MGHGNRRTGTERLLHRPAHRGAGFRKPQHGGHPEHRRRVAGVREPAPARGRPPSCRTGPVVTAWPRSVQLVRWARARGSGPSALSCPNSALTPVSHRTRMGGGRRIPRDAGLPLHTPRERGVVPDGPCRFPPSRLTRSRARPWRSRGLHHGERPTEIDSFSTGLYCLPRSNSVGSYRFASSFASFFHESGGGRVHPHPRSQCMLRK